MTLEVLLVHTHIIGKYHLMHKVEIVTLEGHHIAHLGAGVSFRAYINLVEFDVLFIGNRGQGLDFATLGCNEGDDTRFALLFGYLNPDFAHAAALLHVNGCDGVGARQTHFCNLVEMAAEELQRSATQHRTGSEGIESDLISVLVS